MGEIRDPGQPLKIHFGKILKCLHQISEKPQRAVPKGRPSGAYQRFRGSHSKSLRNVFVTAGRDRGFRPRPDPKPVQRPQIWWEHFKINPTSISNGWPGSVLPKPPPRTPPTQFKRVCPDDPHSPPGEALGPPLYNISSRRDPAEGRPQKALRAGIGGLLAGPSVQFFKRQPRALPKSPLAGATIIPKCLAQDGLWQLPNPCGRRAA